MRGSSTLPGGGGELRGLSGQSVERASRVSGDDGGRDALRPVDHEALRAPGLIFREVASRGTRLEPSQVFDGGSGEAAKRLNAGRRGPRSFRRI